MQINSGLVYSMSLVIFYLATSTSQMEQPKKMKDAADSFAKETLIPTEKFNTFTTQNDFSKAAICAFAQEEHILCGVVVGRLQKEGFINYNRCNDLKTKYVLSA